MTEIVLPPNFLSTLFRNLRTVLPEGTLVTEEPDGEDYDKDELLVILKDGGQSGPRFYTFWDCLTTVEVRHKSRAVALETARKVDGLLRGLQIPNASYISSLGNPTYSPDEERRIPAYSWTVEHRVRGESVQVEDIRFR